MEKETELYLIKRIKELEDKNEHLDFENACLRGKQQLLKEDLRKEFEQEYNIKYRGHDVNKLLSKSQALDKLVSILGIEVCNWVDEKRYEIRSRITSQIIDEETFKELWGAIND